MTKLFLIAALALAVSLSMAESFTLSHESEKKIEKLSKRLGQITFET